MTEAEIIALGEPKTETTTQVEEKAVPVEAVPKVEKQEKPKNGPAFPEDWPEAAINRINKQHGQRIALKAQLDAANQARIDMERKLRDVEQKNKSLEAELPKYMKSSIEQAQGRYELLEAEAAADI